MLVGDALKKIHYYKLELHEKNYLVCSFSNIQILRYFKKFSTLNFSNSNTHTEKMLHKRAMFCSGRDGMRLGLQPQVCRSKYILTFFSIKTT